MTPPLHTLSTAEAAEFETIAKAYTTGIALVPRPYGADGTPAMHSSGGDFAKWLKHTHKELEVHLPPAATPRVVLRNNDCWLPLIWLGSAVAFPVFLNILSNYLYDRAKGALKGDKPNAHVKVVFKDGETGTLKQFEFEGDEDQLKAVMKKFDPNKFLKGDEK